MAGEPQAVRVEHLGERVVGGVEAPGNAAVLLGRMARAGLAARHGLVWVIGAGQEEVDRVLGPVEEGPAVGLGPVIRREGFLQAYLILDRIEECPNVSGYSPKEFLKNNLGCTLAPIAEVAEIEDGGLPLHLRAIICISCIAGTRSDGRRLLSGRVLVSDMVRLRSFSRSR